MDFLIFVAVGTHPQQFNRLLEKVDELVAVKKITEKVFAQTGYTDLEPKNFNFKKFTSLKEFEELIARADIVITHGGEGVIGTALQYNKKIIIVPRLKKFGEHTNDHQLELTKAIEREKRALTVYDIEDLEKALKEIKTFKVIKGTGQKKIVKFLNEFVWRNFK
ncbi:MAG: PssE/Cps14G family polysaccharide biosynthesis glycosyltransferase [archaeon]